MLILGIESSCDETAAAVVADGSKVLSSEVVSQMQVHHPYGGVVPELASRQHLQAIEPVVADALAAADVLPGDLSAVAVTQGPGLVGSLLVGFSYAKAYAFGHGLACVGVDHLCGHLHSVLLTEDPPAYPYVALLASGGHTGIYHVTGPCRYELLGQTRDDAAGEAYDKVAKMLGLGYPGGQMIDELAASGDAAKAVFPRPFLDKDGFDFSFSGVKTAVNRFIQQHRNDLAALTADIAAGFQAAVVEVLTHKILLAAEKNRCRHLAIVGGVAANSGLAQQVRKAARKRCLDVHIPPVDLCGDNAAMIAAAGYHLFKAGARLAPDADVYSRSTRPKTLVSTGQ